MNLRRIRTALAGAAGAALCAVLTASCGAQSGRTPAGDGGRVVTAPLDTSLVTAQGTWAIAVMGGPAAAHDDFWQLFVRPAGASRWTLVTPPGVADNGGLVGAGTQASLTVGFRPSQGLTFSPLAASTDTGQKWTPGLLDAALADTPDALAVAPSGRALALLQDGTVMSAPTQAAADAGDWRTLTTRSALAATAPGRACGLAAVRAVSFGHDADPVVGGSCSRPGVAGLFAEAGQGWAAAGPVLPARFRRDRVQLLGLTATPDANGAPGAALLLAGDSLLAAWRNGNQWSLSAPTPAAAVRASGFGAGDSAWLLLAGGRAETISGPGGAWRALPPAPAGTATLAPGAGGYDALAASGPKLTVWQLAGPAWTRAQLIDVPIEYGSSS